MTTRVRRWAPRLGLPSGDMWEMPVRPTPSLPAVGRHALRIVFGVPNGRADVVCGTGHAEQIAAREAGWIRSVLSSYGEPEQLHDHPPSWS